MNLMTRIVSRSSRKKLAAPQTVKTISETTRVLTFPNLSARLPTANPVNPTARDGRVIIKDTAKSLSGKAAWINGSAGATAAPPMSISMETRSIDSKVSLVGTNAPLSVPFIIARM